MDLDIESLSFTFPAASDGSFTLPAFPAKYYFCPQDLSSYTLEIVSPVAPTITDALGEAFSFDVSSLTLTVSGEIEYDAYDGVITFRMCAPNNHDSLVCSDFELDYINCRQRLAWSDSEPVTDASDGPPDTSETIPFFDLVVSD